MRADALHPRAARRRVSGTLFAYVAKAFTFWFLALFGILVAVIALANTVEMLDRLSGKDEVALSAVLELSMLRVPQYSLEVLPFAILGAAMGLFWRLTRTHELVVTRAAGVSIWQLLMPPIAVAVMLGVIAATVVNPLAVILVKRYFQLEAELLDEQSSIISVFETGLWLRQVSPGRVDVIHAERISGDGSELERVMVLTYDDRDRFQQRLDADRAILETGQWRLFEVWVSAPGQGTQRFPEATLPTQLTRERLSENFAPPETIGFWQIPAYVEVLEVAGLPTERLKLQFHRLLAMPLLFASMVVIAATFALRPPRRGGVTFVIAVGVAVGFVLYFLSNFVFALGLSGKLPLILAAWTPTTVCLMLGVTTLLHLEDG
jgi:lipopolysaccharide export system permease protein